MQIQVEAYRWDGRLKYRWPGQLLEANGEQLVVEGVFSREFKTPYHHFMAGDRTREYYPRDQWYNICVIYGKEDEAQGIYCNLAAPPHFSRGVLSYVDLALDLYVSRSGERTVLDQEEFERLAATQMPADMVSQARQSWAELLTSLDAGTGYFQMLREGS